MPSDNDSPLLRALDRAAILALAEESRGARSAVPMLPYESEPGPLRGGPSSAPRPAPNSNAGVLVGALDDADAGVSAQIAYVQGWLRAHPDLLRLLDAGMRAEFKSIETRSAHRGIAFNVIFTVIGAVLGLLLPYLVTWVPAITSSIIGR